MRHISRAGRVLVAAAIIGLAPSASADWPQARHDRARTGQATGRSDIRQPVAYWRRYLGGSLEAAALLLADVNGDGASEVLMISGGRVVAKSRTDAVAWQSENLGLLEFIGLEDVDGKPGDDLLVRSEDRAYLLDVRDGTVVWAEPAGEMGSIGGTRLGDVDGDGLADLLVLECACCRVVSGNSGVVYSFAAGAAAPVQLWQFPAARCGGQNSLTLVDTDSSSPYEVLWGDSSELVLLDGTSGQELARTPSLGTRVQRSQCVPVDIGGSRGQELVCVHDADYEPLENQRIAFALRYHPGDPELDVVWSRILAPVEGGALQWSDLVSDLDGDGRPEVIVSALRDGTWSTTILAAATGAVISDIDGEIATGVVPTPGGTVLLTASDSHLRGWRLAGGQPNLAWTILDATLPQTTDLVRATRSSIAVRAALARVDADDRPDLVTRLRSEPGTLVAYHLDGDHLAEIARHELPGGATADRLWPITAAGAPDLQLAVSSNDGYLTLFDRGLVPATDVNDDVGQFRLRTGGYYASGFRRVDNTPRSARLDDGPERILQVDSRRTVLALDAEWGAFVAPPRVMWEVPSGNAPVVVDRLDGDLPGVACWASDVPATTPPTYSVVAVGGDGRTLWRVPTPARPLNDIVVGRFDDDAVPDLVYQWGDPGDILLRTRALSGRTGALLWESRPVDPGAGRQPAGVAVGRFDDDLFDDVYHQAQRTQVLSGVDGSVRAGTGPGPNFFLPTLVELDGDPHPEVLLHGGPDPVRVLDHDLASKVLQSRDDNRPFPYGAVADCGSGRQVLVEGSNLHPSRLKLTDLSGAEIGREAAVVLAGGALFADETAAQSGALTLGQLTTASVHQDLTGGGRPSAVVGSTDDWLYAIDPCAGTLDFAFAFGAPVGEAIFGDTDGDGRDEILVTVADGYLYTLRNFEIDAPEAVRDTDPFSTDEEDIAELTSDNTLEASWSRVEGAVGYEVAVVDTATSWYVGDEPYWHDAGDATRLGIRGLPLEDGAIYVVAVRAISATGGRSVDAASNGVWVHVPDVMRDPDSPGGGCCNTSGGGLAELWSGCLVLGLAGLLRRARRRLRRAGDGA